MGIEMIAVVLPGLRVPLTGSSPDVGENRFLTS